MERRLSSRDAIFDPVPDSRDDERAYSPAAYLPSKNSDPAELVEKSDWHEDANTRMHAALQNLDDRSRHIMEARWLTDDKATLHDITRERVAFSRSICISG